MRKRWNQIDKKGSGEEGRYKPSCVEVMSDGLGIYNFPDHHQEKGSHQSKMKELCEEMRKLSIQDPD